MSLALLSLLYPANFPYPSASPPLPVAAPGLSLLSLHPPSRIAICRRPLAVGMSAHTGSTYDAGATSSPTDRPPAGRVRLIVQDGRELNISAGSGVAVREMIQAPS